MNNSIIWSNIRFKYSIRQKKNILKIEKEKWSRRDSNPK